jgi:type II secretory pathway pseudopilin PulG
MAEFLNARPFHYRPCRRQDGYVLLTLLLMIALMGLFAVAVLIPIKFQLKRDQETEMIHRGVQYSRAIRNYYKKLGRYPTRLEDLDNTDNLRYLRKHYKDPLTGKDFRLLHYGDPGVTMSGSIGGGVIPGANTVGSMNGSSISGSSINGSSPGNSAFGGTGSAFSQPYAFGSNTNGSLGGGFSSSASSGTSSNAGTSTPGANSAPDSDPSQASSQVAPGTAQGDASSGTQQAQQVFGGGPIVGVASLSKKDTIREFNKKRKYNEWQFVYDPTADRGGLISTPYQPPLQFLSNQPTQNGQPGNNNGSVFGQPTGLGNNNQSLTGGTTSPAPAPPAANPPQQQ